MNHSAALSSIAAVDSPSLRCPAHVMAAKHDIEAILADLRVEKIDDSNANKFVKTKSPTSAAGMSRRALNPSAQLFCPGARSHAWAPASIAQPSAMPPSPPQYVLVVVPIPLFVVHVTGHLWMVYYPYYWI
jgi:hypothetical protein